MKISTFLAAMVAVTLSLGSPLSLITRQIDLPGAFSSINKTTRVELAGKKSISSLLFITIPHLTITS